MHNSTNISCQYVWEGMHFIGEQMGGDNENMDDEYFQVNSIQYRKHYQTTLNHKQMVDNNLLVWFTTNQHRVISGAVINTRLLNTFKKSIQ